ncbi:protein jagged-1b-like [Ruditapes philippinarum]|uniref:protein jagged-1b-like n=1 Tax=Ruditapes philippinarum TaxID=129788 RepID=UPI00295AF0E7|nr:protein jagged-1b-like [Ruditapes philippinarum]
MTFWNFLLLSVFINSCTGSGYFEIQIISIENIRGELSNGTCCGERIDTYRNSTCSGVCNTYLQVCLKQYQTQVTIDGKCTFGNKTTPVLGGNSFRYAAGTPAASIKLPFQFSWTRSYTIIVGAFDKRQQFSGERVIERSSHSGIILPGPSWHTLTHNGPTATLVYRIRVKCDEHYYNTTCSKFCRPRNDRLGHFTCNVNGDNVCLEGWLGSECDIAICKTGCHALHGSCDRPGECRCGFGWQGPLCDRCIPYPGCRHGTCKDSPWTCDCDLNWGGILCDKDLNTCRHRPCHNNGLCVNNEPDNYTCVCNKGFSGRNCEIVDDPCSSSPCSHAGTCLRSSHGFICNCAPGWTGKTCNHEINECASDPCLNKGTCFDRVNGFECLCASGWQGPQCQLNTDECSGRPCVHAHTCKDLLGDYQCLCQDGWTGKDCNINVQDCHGQCQNGGQCIDLVDGYYCLCIPGFDGKDCQHEIHECESIPCHNGGTCIDHIASYTCQCAEGYSGFNCQNDIDPCSPNPCYSGATCFVTNDITDDYFCYCTDPFTGKNCQHRKSIIAQNIDSCTLSIPNSNMVGGIQLISSGICGEHGLCTSRPGGRFDCSCAVGFTGQYCHENINDCSSSPCYNSGTCVDLINSYQCICGDGWEGALCNINKNDCDPNPCRNDGNCIDLVAGYACQCKSGWKGKTCTLRDSQCDIFTCANGGRCVDLGDTFTCKCPRGWEGHTCHTPVARSCDISPCENNSTCVNSGDSFTCICSLGFEGRTCQENIDECNPFPCYNGGKCVDGINRYTCDCPAGFSGPDCRVNINECLSNPCTFGSTCIDGIGVFKCICPVGRSGDRCEMVRGHEPALQSCVFNRRTFRSGKSWRHACKLYSCDDGEISFEELKCGPENCASIPNITSHVIPCAADEICVIQKHVTCLTPPCLPWGDCQPKSNTLASSVPKEHFCYGIDRKMEANCAKITLVYDYSKLPIGTSVESMCISIERIASSKQWNNSTVITVACSEHSSENLLHVLVSIDHDDGKHFETTLRAFVYKITDVISSKQNPNPSLAAITEVIVETPLPSSDNKDAKLLIPLLCSLIGLLGCVAIVLLVVWHRRQSQDIRRWTKAPELTEERTNNENFENFKNLRRYKNPLYEKDKMVGNRNIRPKQYRDFDSYRPLEPDIDGQDMGNTRLLKQDDFVPGANDWSECVQSKTRVKDINIELQKSRYKPNASAFGNLVHGIELDENEVIV